MCNQKMYASLYSVIFLGEKKVDLFNVEQGIAQSCSFPHIIFSIN